MLQIKRVLSAQWGRRAETRTKVEIKASLAVALNFLKAPLLEMRGVESL